MKKKTKVIISLVLVLSIITATFTYLHLNALAQVNGTIENQDLRWALDDDGVFTVNGSGYGPDYTTLNVPWRANKSNIKKVVINEGVQAVGAYWFSGCSNLTSVELPDSLIKLGDHVFSNCTSLESITIPESCCEYYNYMLNGCTSLKWAVLPRDNTASSYTHTIPDYMFSGCSKLENVWVGEDYTKIANNAFRNCSNLKAIVWNGDTISSIGSYYPSSANIVGGSSVGSWCTSNSKKFVNISGSCGTALNYSYDLDTKSLNLTGSGEMTSSPWNIWKYFIYGADFGAASSIYENAFKGCEYLTGELTLPSTVTSIESGAFDGAGCDCYIFAADTISIENGAFGGREKIIFYGKRNSGSYGYVNSQKADYPKWKYYCTKSHYFDTLGGKCVYCDKVQNSKSLEPLGLHSYVYQHRVGSKLYYKCSHCDADNYSETVREVYADFEDALTAENSEYDGRFDINRDGYVNGRDFAVLRDMLKGEKTEYDMTLSNENATAEAQKLYAYIADNYKSKIISGQQESTWMGSEDYEFNYIQNKTGKLPAIRGFDFMGDDFYGVTRRAKAWANRGGIVTICWHCGKSFNGSFNESQSEEFTAEEWEAVLTDGTAENTAFLAAMDKAVPYLRELQSAGIPVLWRPFHEFDGAWFWWGKGGSETFKRLWIMMYNHYTYDCGLNNLIWVLGYSHNGTDYGTNLAEWYPGSRYCDIVGADSYEVAQNGAEARLYNTVYSFVGDSKPMAMHETGLIPTVEQFEGVPWGYFMTWHTTYLTDDNPTDNLSSVYNSDYVITLDELGDIY